MPVRKKISVGKATMASTKSFSSNQRRISDSPDPAPPLKRGDPERTMAALPPPLAGNSILLARFIKNNMEPSLMRGKPGPKRPSYFFSLCSRFTASASFSHFLPKGGLLTL